MSSTHSITVSLFNDSATGHVSISFDQDGRHFEQQLNFDSQLVPGVSLPTSPATFLGVMYNAAGAMVNVVSSKLGPNDGVIRENPSLADRPETTSLQFSVSEEQYDAALALAEASVSTINYAITAQNCVVFVENVLRAAGISRPQFREALADKGGIPGLNPIENAKTATSSVMPRLMALRNSPIPKFLEVMNPYSSACAYCHGKE